MRGQDFISEARLAAKQILDAQARLKALQVEWNALDYSNTLQDGTDANAGYTAAEVGSVVFDTANAIDGLLTAGHATNLAKLL